MIPFYYHHWFITIYIPLRRCSSRVFKSKQRHADQMLLTQVHIVTVPLLSCQFLMSWVVGYNIKRYDPCHRKMWNVEEPSLLNGVSALHNSNLNFEVSTSLSKKTFKRYLKQISTNQIWFKCKFSFRSTYQASQIIQEMRTATWCTMIPVDGMMGDVRAVWRLYVKNTVSFPQTKQKGRQKEKGR